MDKRIRRILKRRTAAQTKKQNWGSILQKTYRLSQPNRNVLDMRPIGQDPQTYDVQGLDIQWYVFDLTLSIGTDMFVNQMVQALCPAGKKWLSFVAGTEIPDEYKDEVNKKLQALTDKYFRFIHSSNFQPIIYECFMDMAVSTGFLTINEGPTPEKPFIFASNPVDNIYADEGPYGTFDAYYRDWHKLPLDHAEVMWPGFKIPTVVKQQEESNDEEETLITVYEIMYYDYDRKNWQYLVIHEGSETVCYEREEDTSIFVGFRVKKLSGETYGRGPSMDAVSAAGTINQALYDEIVSANFSALPMFMGFDDGVFNPNNFHMIPNTVLACAPSASGTWPLQPIPSAGNIQWGQLIIQELRDQINKIMIADPLGSINDPTKTATEMMLRERQAIENRAPKYARLQHELFDPFVERTIAILRKKGHWEDIEVDGKVIAIRYETPLVISEGQQEILTMLQHVQFLQSVYGPEITQGFYNIEDMSTWAAEKLNANLSVIKTREQVLDQVEIVDEQMQQMNAQAAAGAQPLQQLPQG